MNRIHRLVWNHVLQAWVVASELSPRRGKRSGTRGAAALLASVLLAPGAFAADAINPPGDGGTAPDKNVAIGDGSAADCVTPPGHLPQESPGPGWLPGNCVHGTAVGNGAQATFGGVALGDSTIATGQFATAIGTYSRALNKWSLALGTGAVAGDGTATTGQIAIGRNARAIQAGSIAIGENSQTQGFNALALGTNAFASGNQSTAIGNGTETANNYSIAFGYQAKALATGALSLGFTAQANAGHSIALGASSVTYAGEEFTVSIGDAANGFTRRLTSMAAGVADTDAVNVGQLRDAIDAIPPGGASPYLAVHGAHDGSDDASVGTATNSIALGANSLATRDDSVSIGSVGKERQLTNLAAGTADTDAVNVAQLNTVDARVTTNATAIGAANTRIDATNTDVTAANTRIDTTNTNVTAVTDRVDTAETNLTALTGRVGSNETAITAVQTRADGALYYDAADKRQVTFGGAGATDAVRLSNVAAGTADTDAVNLGQLNTVDGRVTTNATAITAANARIDTTDTNVTAITGRVDTAETNLTAVTGRVDTAETGLTTLGGRVGTNEAAITAVQTRADGALYYDAADKRQVTFGGTGATDAVRLSNVAAGTADTDAVNLGQLNTVDGRVTTNATAITAANARIDTTNTNVTAVTGRVDTAETNLTAVTGRVDTAETNLTALTGRVGTNETAITAVQTRADGALYYDAADKRQVTFGGTGATDAVRLSNVAAGTANTDAVNKKQLDDAIDGVAAGAVNPYLVVDGANDGSDNASIGTTTNSVALGANSVASRDDSVSIGSAGNERQLTNLAAGTADTDAVNVAQLNTVDGRVTTNATAIGAANTRIDATNTDVTAANTRIDTTNTNVTAVTGRVDTAETNLTALTGRVGTNETAITAVQTRADGALYYDAADKRQVTFGGTGATDAVRLSNVAAGTADTDAVNLGQLNTVDGRVTTNATAITAANTRIDTTNTNVTAVTGRVDTAETNLTALTGRVGTNETAITAVQTRADGALYYDAAEKRQVTFGGTGATDAVRLSNVAAGTADTDAVNLGQLNTVDGRVTTNATAITAANTRIDATNTDVTAANTRIDTTNTNVTAVTGRVDTAETNLTALTGRVGTNETAITAVQTRADGALYYDAADKRQVTFGGTGATDAVRLSNVAAGTANTDAVNKKQLDDAIDGVAAGAVNPYLAVDGANDGSDNASLGTTSNSVALGANSVASRDNTLSIGSAGNERQLTNLAAGTADTDAVNVAQLNTVDGRVTTNATAITAANARIDGTNADVTALGGRVDGNVTAITAANTRIDTTNTSVIDLTDRVDIAETGLTTLGGRVGTNEAAITAVQTRADGALYYDAADKRQVTFGGAGATDAVRLSNVAAGTANTDAVNKKQLDDAIDGVAAGAVNPYLVVDGANDGSDNASIGTTTNSVALGANSVASRNDTVSIGSAGNERQLTNLAAGTADTDAVNVAQLNTVDARVTTNATAITAANTRIDGTNTTVTALDGRIATAETGLIDLTDRVDTNETAIDATNTNVTALTGRVGTNETSIGALQTRADGALYYDAADKGQVTLGGAGAAGPVRIANVAAGVAGSDAVNLDQLNAVAADIGDGSQNHYVVADGAYDGSDKASTVGTTNAVAIGANAVADRENSVSFGRTGGERQLTHVAAGTANTDAVNVKQLTDAIDGVSAGATNPYLVVDGANDGSDNARTSGTSNAVAIGANFVADRENSVSVGAAGNERVIANVAAGTEDTDAVNVGQLKDAGVIDPGTGRVRDMVAYDTGSTMGQITLAGAGGTRITNLRDGEIRNGSTDAVNGGQIADIRDHLQGQIDGLAGGGVGPGNPGPGPAPGPGGDEHFDAEGDTGKPAQASGTGSVAAGEGAAASGSHGTAVGSTSTASGTSSSAIGAGSTASGANSTALGAGSTASASNAVALGNGSVADRADSVSVGSEGHERQITNVKAGTARTDAVNVGQLQDAMAGANQYTDDRFDVMKDMLDQNSRQANRGIAASAALVNNMPYAPGKVVLNAGVAGYRGESAMGISASRWSDNGRVNVNVGVSQARKDQPIIRFGVGFVFGD
jgi:autotransporter adhesin